MMGEKTSGCRHLQVSPATLLAYSDRKWSVNNVYT